MADVRREVSEANGGDQDSSPRQQLFDDRADCSAFANDSILEEEKEAEEPMRCECRFCGNLLFLADLDEHETHCEVDRKEAPNMQPVPQPRNFFRQQRAPAQADFQIRQMV